MVEIEVSKDYKNADVLVIGLYEDKNLDNLKDIDSSIKDIISSEIDDNPLKKFGVLTLLKIIQNENKQKFLLAGLGKKDKFNSEQIRKITGKIVRKINELEKSSLAIFPFDTLNENQIESISEGIILSNYSFTKFKKNSKPNTLKKVTIVGQPEDKFVKIIEQTQIICESVNFARNLGNMPPNECTPSELASIALSLTMDLDVNVSIMERYEMESIGLNGIISVGKGSINPPKLIIVEYFGGDKKDKPILLVGKAVTFDTGGISIKPSEKMDEMKFDKCGGCNVLGIIRAIASLKTPINAIGIIPTVENVPSSSSYNPGDIIRMYNGKTVEVLNTDAEGRIILGDALAYGIEKYAPKFVIDFATLTGACIVALGTNVAGAMGNNKDLMEKLKSYSAFTGELIWELPLINIYKDQIKSNIADIKNIGGRAAGTITAAAFLSNFVDNTPWIHLDIAGTAWTQEGSVAKSYVEKGATGFGVRLVAKMLIESGDIFN